LWHLPALAQSAQSTQPTEFEGIITYKHSFKPIAKDYDTKKDLHYFGNQSEVLYQNGKLRWNYNSAWLKADLFLATDTMEYLLVTASDTVYFTRNNYANEEIKEYHTVADGGTILGEKCKVFTITTIKNGHEWIRKYYYAQKTAIDAKLFRKYKINSMQVIYSVIQSLPLKIEYIFEDRKVTFTATKVVSKKLDPALFELDPAAARKRL
jgi:hypothetical protein